MCLSRDELAYELYIRGKEVVLGDEEGAVDYLFDVYNKSAGGKVLNIRKLFGSQFLVIQELTLIELKYDQLVKELLTSPGESCTIRAHFLMMRAARIVLVCPEELQEHAEQLCKLLYTLQLDRRTQFKDVPFITDLIGEMRLQWQMKEKEEGKEEGEENEINLIPITPGYSLENTPRKYTPKSGTIMVEFPNSGCPTNRPLNEEITLIGAKKIESLDKGEVADGDLDIISIAGSDSMPALKSPVAETTGPKQSVRPATTPRCFRCNRRGHKQYNCPEKEMRPKHRCQHCRRYTNPDQRYCQQCAPVQHRYQPY